jgi:ABC-2 type transport system ATP-binding protein
MDAISVQDLVVSYPQSSRGVFRAVDDISFTVGEGEIIGFLGVNGAGKTSTIKTIMGFQPAHSGGAFLFGKPIDAADARHEVGFLPETALYSPFLTPLETLTLYGELHGLEGKTLLQRAMELLTRVGLAGKEKLLNRTLSKGMLQRVGIAQSLLSQPRLLILDEVSSGLDPIGRRDLRVLLTEERKRGVTIFFSSHQLSEVETICDRVIIMHRGKIVAEHRVAELTDRVTSLEDYFVMLVESGRDLLMEPTSSFAEAKL